MPRYIDADALLKKIFPYNGLDKNTYTINAKAVEYAICAMPAADVVAVVRCKDCLYAHFNSSSERYSCQREYPRRSVQEDDFCNYGKVWE